MHLLLFDFLKSLPNDGTFDQVASVKRCLTKCQISGKSFGYDLSAATDRLPVRLQVEIISTFLGEEYAHAWKTLLVNRVYTLDHKDYGKHSLTYKVGQPMGALSSWAMLAVTHHLILQLAYRRSGIGNPDL